MKKYLFIMRRAPNCGSHVQETLDMIMTVAAFDRPVALLFADDGVLQLKCGRQPEALGLKDTAAALGALDAYGIETLYAEWESLAARGLETDDLLLPVQCVRRGDVAGLIRSYDVVVPD